MPRSILVAPKTRSFAGGSPERIVMLAHEDKKIAITLAMATFGNLGPMIFLVGNHKNLAGLRVLGQFTGFEAPHPHLVVGLVGADHHV